MAQAPRRREAPPLAGDLTRLLNTHVYPAWRDRPFLEIRKSDVAQLLDTIEDDRGARQADMILAIVRSVMNWRAARSDDYSAAIGKGMQRTSPKERARARTLNDDELRAVWKASEGDDPFGAFVRLLLLTGQRRNTVASMRWQDVAPDGTWTIPAEAREKGNAGELKLPDAALALVHAQPTIGDSPFVFSGRRAGKGGEHAFATNFGKRKAMLDVKVAAALGETPPPWTLHDLRRTARTLLSRANVRPDVAERVLGHVQPGIQSVYDRHSYTPEKAAALAKLATLLNSILHPRPADVVPLKPRSHSR